MATGDPILVGNANRGDVGFGDATILSAEPRSALDCVLYVEPIGKRAGNGIIARSWSATPSGGWALQAAGDLVWSDGLLSFGRTAIMAQGNQFGAIVAGDDDTPGALVLPDGRRIQLGNEPVRIGRLPDCAIALSDSQVSRHHAEVRRGEQGFSVVDLGSLNGTSVNGVVIQEHALVDGDVINVGETAIRYEES